ncbi:MAG: FixH family protein [Gemmatimonadota bacterium]|nr:FixH family protein [Gemmatimonadota bacterium]
MAERLFELLFKYRPVVFARGDLVFASPWPLIVVLALGALALAIGVTAYRRTGAAMSARERGGLLGLRIGAVAVLVFCLTGPALRVTTVVPQQNFLGILVDDSRSMRVADGDGRTRGALATEMLAPAGPLMRALGERFKLRVFGFSETLGRADSVGALTFDGRRTDLTEALAAARRDLATVPLAGLVLVTDGADNAAGVLAEPLLALAADGVPVHVVGVGRETLTPDVELSRIGAPATVLEGTAVAVELAVRAAGYEGRRVPLQVEDEGRILARTEIRLPASGEPSTVRAHFVATEAGPRRVRFSIPLQDGELIAENNAVEALITVKRRTERILYFEGEPRFELKFLRRAVAEDKGVAVVTLLRTAEDKFLRLGVEDANELAAGFPRTRAELFRYRGLILGSVEASFFTHDQLQMLAEFVSVRGGGLLALGGRHAFAEGGWTETPLADVLPVMLERTARADTTPFFTEVTVELTPAGRDHPTLQVRSGAEASAARWDSLPALSTLNPVREVKAGASALLLGRGDGGPYVVLATQRYGRGRSVALPVQDSWIWQMHADIPPEDETHEAFWRQLLRHLLSDVPDPLDAAVSVDRVEPGRPLTLSAEVADSGYVRLNGADVQATVVDPAGGEHAVPLRWTVRHDGEYEATYEPSLAGRYEVRVTASQGGQSLGQATTYFEAGDVGAEFFGAGRQTGTLRRIAEETGGRYYTPANLRTLPEDVSFTESGATVVEHRDLWDMPVLLLTLVGLLSAEWIWRRHKGLA